MSTTIDPADFRKVMGQVPTCVTVVTGLVDGTPLAMVIGSFVSVSLDPPMAGFFATSTSGSWLALKEAPVLGVNVLADGQVDTSNAFMRPPEDRFEGIDWTEFDGAPRIAGCGGWVAMTQNSISQAGDHDFILCDVTSMQSADPELAPLVFHAGGYRTLEAK